MVLIVKVLINYFLKRQFLVLFFSCNSLVCMDTEWIQRRMLAFEFVIDLNRAKNARNVIEYAVVNLKPKRVKTLHGCQIEELGN